ncbi:lipoprotein-anchoring transpeptidase ErfK/SrfK [Allocatelliglobosispora scoriae]|uniref:Lipoprotein-anchoring transpeptidase ErfK/SrfK n=1 Tax=Allocatelliglobosispora scoriae TaxID=643052 RepID=A0A841BSF3_9ACTN|nr:Ig-like domain-containing protein [Allocatelliglobosispora scoriae]MBB5870119.1 lipoprotein-anchoring transpeptidase ErfK/SrfK [Allocatelliglobosispora scoriae]
MSDDRRTPSISRRAALAGAGLVGVASVAGLAACSPDAPKWAEPGSGNSDTPAPPADPTAASATITAPKHEAKDVHAAIEVAFTLANASTATVELQDAAGTRVSGALRADGTSWVPNAPLKYNTTYTVTVTANGADGKTGTATSSFTTMAKPSKTISASSYSGDKAKVGIGMPLMVKFSRSVPKAKRAEVQKRLFVDATPEQDGIWHWFSGSEVHFRPKEYWKAGTKISFRVAVGGLDMGGGYFGKADITIDDMLIGPAIVLTADNATKKMTATKDGVVLRTMPISLGKASTPSSSGKTVIIEKFVHTIFDTFDELGPELGYRTPIDYAQRITWGGEYIHSAPWSVGSQGHRNVSHGCVNVSPSNAKWLFDLTQVGTPMITKGTERKLKAGNGWTHWNLTWDEYVKGSALPFKPVDTTAGVEPSTEPSTSPSASPSAVPSTSPTSAP